MQAITPDALTLIEEHAPRFIPAATRAAAEPDSAGLVLTLDAFAGEPKLFYACAWYASVHNIPIYLAPSPPRAE